MSAVSGNLYNYTHFTLEPILFRRRVSSFGIATGYGLDDRGFGVRVLVG
jgi:hypothetical protein